MLKEILEQYQDYVLKPRSYGTSFIQIFLRAKPQLADCPIPIDIYLKIYLRS